MTDEALRILKQRSFGEGEVLRLERHVLYVKYLFERNIFLLDAVLDVLLDGICTGINPCSRR